MIRRRHLLQGIAATPLLAPALSWADPEKPKPPPKKPPPKPQPAPPPSKGPEPGSQREASKE